MLNTAAAKKKTKELEDEILRILANSDEVCPPSLWARLICLAGVRGGVLCAANWERFPRTPSRNTHNPQSLLEDVNLVTTLKTSKQTSLDIQKQLKDAEVPSEFAWPPFYGRRVSVLAIVLKRVFQVQQKEAMVPNPHQVANVRSFHKYVLPSQ